MEQYYHVFVEPIPAYSDDLSDKPSVTFIAHLPYRKRGLLPYRTNMDGDTAVKRLNRVIKEFIKK